MFQKYNCLKLKIFNFKIFSDGKFVSATKFSFQEKFFFVAMSLKSCIVYITMQISKLPQTVQVDSNNCM